VADRPYGDVMLLADRGNANHEFSAVVGKSVALLFTYPRMFCCMDLDVIRLRLNFLTLREARFLPQCRVAGWHLSLKTWFWHQFRVQTLGSASLMSRPLPQTQYATQVSGRGIVE